MEIACGATEQPRILHFASVTNHRRFCRRRTGEPIPVEGWIYGQDFLTRASRGSLSTMRSRLPDENTRADIVGVGSGERPGGEVIGISGDRQTVIGDGVSKRIILKKGPNIVRAAVINGGGATDFCALFLDADDKPMRGFTASLTEARK